MQQEFVQAYQLGALEDDYALNPRKLLANFVFILAFAIIAPVLVFGIAHSTANPTSFILPSFIFFLVVGGGALLIFYFSYRHLHVYIYTNGLVYHNKNQQRVIYWQQIKRASTMRGYLYISVNGAAVISIPSYISRFRELRSKIAQEIAAHQYPG
ncbi:MAG TPA: DUF6585 family protein [Ktedonosporobacter sp.]|jgi:hypothetical protein|nr:DUF6585 family protein [Ktedonosporobacter sp.]